MPKYQRTPPPFPLPKWLVRYTHWLLTSRSAEQQGGTGEQEHQHKVLQWGSHTWGSQGSRQKEGKKKKRGAKKTPAERNFLLLSHSLPQLSRFTIPCGKANGRWEKPSSLLLHYTRPPSCLGSRHRSADAGEAPASASQPRGISPRRGTAARSPPSWEPSLFPTQLHDIEERARLRRKHNPDASPRLQQCQSGQPP